MWIIIKFDKKNLELLKRELKTKMGNDFVTYNPKFLFKKYINNKYINKEYSLLGDYLFCFHKNLQNPKNLNSIKFTKGLKYILNGFIQSQEEIKKFVEKCRDSEDQKGYLTQNFFELCVNSRYQFTSGPFAETIFQIINLQKNKMGILLGDIKTTIRKTEFLFNPI